MTSVKKSRATLIGVVLAFALPVIGAKFVLDQSWYQGAATNKGTMLMPPIKLNEALQAQLPEGWRVALVADEACGAKCEQGLYAMNQLDVALGKESDRVKPLVFSRNELSFDLNQTPLVTSIVNPAFADALSDLPPYRLFIIDPMGNVMLHYETFGDEEAMRAEAKNLLSDLRTLLKLSRIG
ncbi:hypothetical protein PSI9734_01095 [Pseudidiomarina piscicola]|uniref:Transmembrane cytochrome oxidase associated protein n=1 Tax=Pseudidiomarina piscicola TaxID=2614830 RepID=A0A6S6WU61_9GAMM|nr:hypothetical protein [Pseudidiomarina piscicola]CAB0150652.1 hypothetical protein PSI9734_01095 [Pseudidiomarina piscicola]VZT40155.1 hypothetical protein PSI9734_01095 [Pseudomonas aeruginosa]